MPIVIIIIGAILIVTAYSGTYAQLATELESDVPAYFKWGIALGLLVAAGYIPGFKTPVRWLLALVVLVIVLKNWPNIQKSFSSFTGIQPPQSTGTTTI